MIQRHIAVSISWSQIGSTVCVCRLGRLFFHLSESVACGDFSEAERTFFESRCDWHPLEALRSSVQSRLLVSFGHRHLCCCKCKAWPNMRSLRSRSMGTECDCPLITVRASPQCVGARLELALCDTTCATPFAGFSSNHTLVGSRSICEVARVEGPPRSLVGRSWIVSAAITYPVIPTKLRLQLPGSR
jgi:hypothetical protein